MIMRSNNVLASQLASSKRRPRSRDHPFGCSGCRPPHSSSDSDAADAASAPSDGSMLPAHSPRAPTTRASLGASHTTTGEVSRLRPHTPSPSKNISRGSAPESLSLPSNTKENSPACARLVAAHTATERGSLHASTVSAMMQPLASVTTSVATASSKTWLARKVGGMHRPTDVKKSACRTSLSGCMAPSASPARAGEEAAAAPAAYAPSSKESPR
mmetsp:Transcript_8691/g.26951  ORF Transcript_8691/g.26951 Transcript_8691/m.26951 type:complete len:215 (-) Transcript_8691:2352-2996(-)